MWSVTCVQYDGSLDVKGEIRRDTLSAGGVPCGDGGRGEAATVQGLQGEQEAEEVRKAPSLTH